MSPPAAGSSSSRRRVLPGLPVSTVLESREWVSMPFVRAPQHPVLSGVASWDLHFWSPDHVSARGAYSKPDGGAFVALVDSGAETGLEWVEMMECYRGRGFYLLNQFPVVGRYDVEPMAGELLNRLMAYAAGEKPFRTPTARLLVSAEPASAVVSKLRSLGVSLSMVDGDPPLTEASILLVDAGRLPAAFAPPARWSDALRSGATLIVHGARPEHDAWLSALAGKQVSLTAQPFGMWEGRAYRNGYTWLTPGLSQIDLYWKRYDGSEGRRRQADDPSLKIEDSIRYSAAAQGAVEHIFPGGLVEIPVGRGRLVLDQLRWETPNPQLERLSARVVSALMTGLGVAIEPYAPARALPREIAYKPLDLTSLANRGFIDEKGEDGQGGWSDQGPDCDLRSFPTGRQNFGGVPFLVGAEPRCCIVLQVRRAALPRATARRRAHSARLPRRRGSASCTRRHMRATASRSASTGSSTRTGARKTSRWWRARTFATGPRRPRSCRTKRARRAASPGPAAQKCFPWSACSRCSG